MIQDYRVMYTTDENIGTHIVIMRCNNRFELFKKLNARLGFPNGLRIQHAVNLTMYENHISKIKEILIQ